MAKRTLIPGSPPVRERRAGTRRTSHDNVRAVAAWALERTLSSQAPVDSFLDSARWRCDVRDHPLLLDLVLGTLRWLRRLDQMIAAAANRRLNKIEASLKAPLRVATYQLMFCPQLPRHIVIEEAVEQAHCLTHRGGASFVDAVLRRLARHPHRQSWPVEDPDPVRRLAIEMSHPDFLVKRWLEHLGRSQTSGLLEANNRPRPHHLLAFRHHGGRELLAESLIDEGLEVEASALSPLGLKVRAGDPRASLAFRRGDFHLQDEASQIASLIPKPQPEESVLDLTPGITGPHCLAVIGCEPSVRCVLAEASATRAAALSSHLRRLGCPSPVLVSEAARPAAVSTFDRVIVGLPGSSTGTLNEHPELKWRIQDHEIGREARNGARILHGAASLVRPNGHLIVLSQSLEREENEAVVDDFLRHSPRFTRLPLANLVPSNLREAIVGAGFWRLVTADDHGGVTVHVLGLGKNLIQVP